MLPRDILTMFTSILLFISFIVSIALVMVHFYEVEDALSIFTETPILRCSCPRGAGKTKASTLGVLDPTTDETTQSNMEKATTSYPEDDERTSLSEEQSTPTSLPANDEVAFFRSFLEKTPA